MDKRNKYDMYPTLTRFGYRSNLNNIDCVVSYRFLYIVMYPLQSI